MASIAFVTCTRWPELSQSDSVAAAALSELGHTVVPTPWQAGPAALADTDLVVHRSQWDYHYDLPGYTAWLDSLESLGVPTVNPLELIRWNLSKRYLLELSGRGVDTPATAEVGPDRDMRTAFGTLGLSQAVIKPLVSASGHLVELVQVDDIPHWEAEVRSQRAAGSWLVQELVPEIMTRGELSLVFTGGDYSHAIAKLPRPGEFRVNGRFSAEVKRVDPSTELVRQAREVIALLPRQPTYARIDGVPLPGDALRVMEVELHEPGLSFHLAPEQAARFARTLTESL